MWCVVECVGGQHDAHVAGRARHPPHGSHQAADDEQSRGQPGVHPRREEEGLEEEAEQRAGPEVKPLGVLVLMGC